MKPRKKPPIELPEAAVRAIVRLLLNAPLTDEERCAQATRQRASRRSRKPKQRTHKDSKNARV